MKELSYCAISPAMTTTETIVKYAKGGHREPATTSLGFLGTISAYVDSGDKPRCRYNEESRSTLDTAHA